MSKEQKQIEKIKKEIKTFMQVHAKWQKAKSAKSAKVQSDRLVRIMERAEQNGWFQFLAHGVQNELTAQKCYPLRRRDLR